MGIDNISPHVYMHGLAVKIEVKTAKKELLVSFIPQELAQHPAIKTMLDYKWKHFARWLFA